MISRIHWILVALLLVGVTIAQAQTQQSEPTQTATASTELTPVELTATDLDTFLAPIMSEQIEKHKVAGIVVSFVKDGTVIFAKGYGHADVAAQKPMTADHTLMRPGSISKLFTAIAVMQLVEQGKLDLDADVNSIIDFAIPTPDGGVPVTLRRLMTHRAGFEDQLKDLITFSGSNPPLGVWLKEHLPPRIYPHGDVPSYSNYGVALAGYIVERVSGETFADYVTTHILAPLGMTKSSFQQPLPPALAALVSQAYYSSDTPALAGFEMIPAAPAGALSASANDMARFAMALLNKGTLDSQSILKPETLALMMSPQVRTAAGDMGLQFLAQDFAGRTYWGHTGGTAAVMSNFLLLPEENFGLFISFNSAGNGRGLIDVPRKIAARYFPKPYPAPQAMLDEERKAKHVGGIYQVSKVTDQGFLKAASLVQQMAVVPQDDGTITVRAALDPSTAQGPLPEVAPGVFRRPNTGTLVSFADSERYGRILQTGAPALEFHLVPWYESGRIILPAFALSILFLALSLLWWPIATVIRARRKAQFGTTALDQHDYRSLRLAALVPMTTIAALVAIALASGGDVTKLNAGLDPYIIVMYVFAWASIPAAFVVAFMAYRLWVRDAGSKLSRFNHMLMACAVAFLTWFFVAYNIVGTTLQF